MARKIFFTCIALIPASCFLPTLATRFFLPETATAQERLQYSASMGSLVYYVIIGLIAIALATAVYDKVATSVKEEEEGKTSV